MILAHIETCLHSKLADNGHFGMCWDAGNITLVLCL